MFCSNLQKKDMHGCICGLPSPVKLEPLHSLTVSMRCKTQPNNNNKNHCDEVEFKIMLCILFYCLWMMFLLKKKQQPPPPQKKKKKKKKKQNTKQKKKKRKKT